MIKTKIAIFLSLLTVQAISSIAEESIPETIDFNEHIRPILSDQCYFCHGPDNKKRKAKLRLDTREGALAETRFGEADFVITPGKPEESELYLRLIHEDPEEIMPPKKSKLPNLSKTQVALVRKWIEQGANYDTHWAYRPVKNYPVPQVKNKTWPKNAIDYFILSRVEKQGWAPSARADKEKLIRRVTFDLTGLPPTLKEIDDYLADKSPSAFEKVVDRLLASKQYAERMTTEWLDVARYSDTYGYQVDRDRYVWPWRDWVIRAFDKNLPYDQFITEQLAGDLLPNATDDQILATTFNRLHPQKVEGGSTPEEFRVEYVADRTHTFGTAFLGMTLECSRCHTHKYDPITINEYYQFYAFFNNIDEAGLYSYFTPSVPTPTLLMMDAGKKATVAQLRNNIKNEVQKLELIKKQHQAGFDAWLSNTTKIDEVSGQIAHLDFEKYKSGANKSIDGPAGKAVLLTGDDVVNLNVGNFQRHQAFSVSLMINTPDVKDRAVIYHRSRAWTDAGSRGYELLLEDGRLSAALIHFYPGNAIRVKTVKPIATNHWLNVAVTYDGSSKARGLKIYIDGKQAETEVVRDNLYKEITGGGGNNIAIGERFRDRGFKNGKVDEFKVFNKELTELEIGILHTPDSVKQLLAGDKKQLTPAQNKLLLEYYLKTQVPEYKNQEATVAAVRLNLNQTLNSTTEIMVMRELEKQRTSYVLERGAYDQHGEVVQPATPAFLPEFKDELPRNRLGLAKWLTSPENPLTSRVTVNRYWQMIFGNGLVRTPEDFGSQGSQPTHPELLDYLSHDFMVNNWDVKRLLKTMVMSATYQQDSVVTKQHLEKDPENLLLARASSYRISAEMLRDNALAVSGRLINKIGGPSVKPYEVEVSFKPAKRDKGNGLYRRSLYTYWKRTGPAPVMMSLDASKRDVCRVKRERTSSPIQAFVMLNGLQFVEASRHIAEWFIKQHKENDELIVYDMFRILTSRKPTAEETRIILNLYKEQLTVFEKNPEQAKKYLSIGDTKSPATLANHRLAAFALVANTLLNHDESVMKR